MLVGAKGNIVRFVAEMENISTKEAFARINGETALEEYAERKKLSYNYLKINLGLESGNNCVKIPYYDEEHKQVAMRFRYSKKSKNKNRFSWQKNSKIILYGLWTLKDATDDYIILVERRVRYSKFMG